MDLLMFIFRLGVVFAIFGFIWGLIQLGILIISAGRTRSFLETYIIKAIQYVLLVDITFLICYDNIIDGLDYTSQLVFGAAILTLYFVGKLQRKQSKQRIFQVYSSMIPQRINSFHVGAEIAVIALAVIIFILFWTHPHWAINPISLWFQTTILDIEDTPIFGFIFQVIGFLFLLNIVMKVVNSVFMLLSGKAFIESKDKNQDDNHFDPYQEIK